MLIFLFTLVTASASSSGADDNAVINCISCPFRRLPDHGLDSLQTEKANSNLTGCGNSGNNFDSKSRQSRPIYSWKCFRFPWLTLAAAARQMFWSLPLHSSWKSWLIIFGRFKILAQWLELTYSSLIITVTLSSFAPVIQLQHYRLIKPEHLFFIHSTFKLQTVLQHLINMQMIKQKKAPCFWVSPLEFLLFQNITFKRPKTPKWM